MGYCKWGVTPWLPDNSSSSPLPFHPWRLALTHYLRGHSLTPWQLILLSTSIPSIKGLLQVVSRIMVDISQNSFQTWLMHLDHRNLPDWDKPSTFLRQQVSTFLQSSYESIANVQEKATLAQFGKLSTKMTLIQAQVLLRQTQMWTVQCCVARNCRRRSVARYKGVAKVTSGRARKGFQLRYNPNNHWIAALYRNSAYLQYTDGTNIRSQYKPWWCCRL